MASKVLKENDLHKLIKETIEIMKEEEDFLGYEHCSYGKPKKNHTITIGYHGSDKGEIFIDGEKFEGTMDEADEAVRTETVELALNDYLRWKHLH